MSNHLRVLVLSSEPPYPPTHGGARLKLYRVLQHVAQHHDVTLLTLLESPAERDYLPALREVCRKVIAFDRRPVEARPSLSERCRAPFYRLAYTAEMAAAIQQELCEHSYDLVHVDMAHMAVYTPLLAKQRKIIAAHDSQTVSYASRLPLAKTPREKLYSHFRLGRVRDYERRFYAQYDACVVVADEDRDMLHRLCPQLPIEIVPNGIDLEYFKPQGTGAEEANHLVFTGTMDFAPNVDCVQWFVADILPRIERLRPNVRLNIVGRNPTEAVCNLATKSNVSVTGFVPDLRPYLAKAAVYVCPLRLGSGMKNKMLEAMAMGKAIVTTVEGTSGLGGHDGNEYVIADQPDAFAEAVQALLDDAQRRQHLGETARSFVETHYSWNRTGELFDALYRRTANS